MLRRFLSFVFLLGRGATYALGLVALGLLVLGPASLGLAAIGDALTLGQSNNSQNKTTALTANLAQAALKITNSGDGAALRLQVDEGRPPLTVPANAGKATNLDADKLDGKDASAFAALTFSGAVDEDPPAVAAGARVQDKVELPGSGVRPGDIGFVMPTGNIVANGPLVAYTFRQVNDANEIDYITCNIGNTSGTVNAPSGKWGIAVFPGPEE